jgi:hypothetical protein
VLAAMQTVCRNLEIAPGTVVFGHTHVALDDVATPDGRHRLFNSGSWVWNPRTRSATTHGAAGAPGTVLRATGGALELRSLLGDCSADELAQMVGAPRERRPFSSAQAA